MANKANSKNPPILLSIPGCGTCSEVKKALKKKKKTNQVKIISTATKKGVNLAIESKTNLYPQCLKISKKGKPVKCDTVKFLKKFGIQIK